MFEDCTLDIAKVEGGNWSFVVAARRDLHSATFTGVRLREADLTGIRAAGGTLRDCDLAGAWLDRADLTGCDLRGSDLSGIDPATVTLDRAIITLRAGRDDRRGDGSGPAGGVTGAPYRIRTDDPLFTRQVLWPTELRRRAGPG